MKMQNRLIERLSQEVLVWDGAMGTQIQGADIPMSDFCLSSIKNPTVAITEALGRLGDKPLDGCNELLNLTRPELIQEIHERYFAAGSDMVETNTFGCTTVALGEYDVPELVYEVAFAAGKLARAAADKFSTPEKPRFAIGALGPGTKLVTLGQVSFDDLVATYCDAFTALINSGVDGLLLETLQDLLMVKAGIVGAKQAFAQTGKNLPLFVQVTMEQTGTMLLGSEMGAVVNMLECFPEVVAIGMNCATGPLEMTTHVRFLSQNSTRPLSVQPNAGLPIMENGRGVYKLTPQELAEHHVRFVTEFGVTMVGGCCGTTPAHIEAVCAAVKGLVPSLEAQWQKVRTHFPAFNFNLVTPDQYEAFALVGSSSLYGFQPYQQDNSYLIIGEKTNANGSRAFRDLLAESRWEALTEFAKEQELEGSHILDVCTAFVGRDEVADMQNLLPLYNKNLTIPVMVDSTEVPVVEAALKCLAGKPIINSINFEDGEERTQKVLALARKYGAAVVGLTIDETGMAKSVEHKVEIASRLVARTRAAGLADHDLFIDCLTFTLGSGDEEFRASGLATIEAIRQVKQLFPRVNMTLGVSNISFGLKPAARQVLNSVFLKYCEEAGLTSAIVHFSKVLPENRIDPEVWKIASDLVYDRREFALS